MMRGVLRTLRYARSWKAGAEGCAEIRAHVTECETAFERDGVQVPATLVLPAQRVGPVSAWIALGGISRMGRHHPQLVRFTRALASTGVAVVVPEIPEWRRLRVTPCVAAPTLLGCVEMLRGRPEVRPGKVALIGFSFGAPQVALAGACDVLSEHVAGTVLFGSYCSLDRTVDCMFTGRHEWKGTEHELEPDPYGRWVLGSNHLVDVPGHEDAGGVAAALHQLADAASGQRVPAWDPHHDTMISQLRSSLPQSRRRLFDLFATPSNTTRPCREELSATARALAAACRRCQPLLDPESDFARIRLPTRLIHGRGDRLIPFTEGKRLMARLTNGAAKALTVTALLNHSADHTPDSAYDRARENVAFFESIRGLINTV
jgi:pimeloyl-ACP methyl ester carboxylesterase